MGRNRTSWLVGRVIGESMKKEETSSKYVIKCNRKYIYTNVFNTQKEIQINLLLFKLKKPNSDTRFYPNILYFC